MNNGYEALLSLIRLGIGHSSIFTVHQFDWAELKQLANEQGLSAVVLEGVEKLPDSSRPQKNVLLNWIGEVLQNYEC